ncbi:MAG: hypothetical protein R6U21_06765 [Thermoplasmatota archaeon]
MNSKKPQRENVEYKKIEQLVHGIDSSSANEPIEKQMNLTIENHDQITDEIDDFSPP